MALPKATVQLQAPTQPLGTSFTSPALGTLSADDDDDSDNEGIVNILSIVGFAAAVVVLGFQLMTANTWISAEDKDPAKKGDWMQLLE